MNGNKFLALEFLIENRKHLALYVKQLTIKAKLPCILSPQYIFHVQHRVATISSHKNGNHPALRETILILITFMLFLAPPLEQIKLNRNGLIALVIKGQHNSLHKHSLCSIMNCEQWQINGNRWEVALQQTLNSLKSFCAMLVELSLRCMGFTEGSRLSWRFFITLWANIVIYLSDTQPAKLQLSADWVLWEITALHKARIPG